ESDKNRNGNQSSQLVFHVVPPLGVEPVSLRPPGIRRSICRKTPKASELFSTFVHHWLKPAVLCRATHKRRALRTTLVTGRVVPVGSRYRLYQIEVLDFHGGRVSRNAPKA